MMTKPVRLGMLTPSSNTVLEPVTTAMLAALPEASAHFSRFRALEISLDARSQDQFALDAMMGAARLLAEARVTAICWNGASAGWLGIDRDRSLCQTIQKETGVPATSSVLALLEAFKLAGVKRYGLVTPYVRDVQQRILDNFKAEGFECVADRFLSITDNFAFSEVSEARLEATIREVARGGPQAIVVLCTNLRAAPVVDLLERDIGIPVYDTIATAVWGSLRLAKVDPKRVQGWGRIFRDLA